MIAAATSFTKLLFNWFDIAVVLIVGLGFWRGRKNGMTKEIFPSLRWLTIVVAGGFCYKLLGDLLVKQGVIRSVFGKALNEKTAAYISAYVLITIVVLLIFTFLKRSLKQKLEGSNLFGSSEYYFGMIAGMIRFVCILMFFLAMLNAPFYTAADIQADIAYKNRWFGGGMSGYSGDFFPTISELQVSVFKDSLAGPVIHKNLNVVLINTVPPGGPAPKPAVVDIQH